MNEKIQLFLADDHAVVRKGLEALIGTQPDMTVVGTAANGEEAVRLALQLQPDVILIDIQMPLKTGVEAIVEIKAANPDARLLVLTSYSEDETVFAAIKAGAMGYLLKDSTPQELIQAIRNVYNGRSFLHPDIALKVIQELHKPPVNLPPTDEPLTEREVDVLKLVARGLSNHDIANRLVISERTVRTHISNILSKLHLANRTQAALYALRQGLAPLDEDE
ncbi:MAG: response regulator transcription factor [Anaerolineales bacterium]|nr:response regulator transcription factor [Anaerolineales bacterium]MCA9926975.1 response regulator transcription factor [Anaerolineales bacterium]